MPVPDVPSLRLPFLRCVADGKPHAFADVCSALAAEFNLPEAEKHAVRCQAGSVRALLIREGLLEATGGKGFRITPRGLRFLKAGTAPSPPPLRPHPPSGGTAPLSRSEVEEVFDTAERCLVEKVKQRVRSCSPAFFERVAVDLLAAMGYACVRTAGAAKVVGGPGDGGIDGVLHADPLGFSPVYVQAKKRDGNGCIGPTDVRTFVGALQTRGAARGVFVTTGKFSEDALAVCGSPRPDCTVVLIDGDQLVRYLIEYNVGVTVKATYQVKDVDPDYFAEP